MYDVKSNDRSSDLISDYKIAPLPLLYLQRRILGALNCRAKPKGSICLLTIQVSRSVLHFRFTEHDCMTYILYGHVVIVMRGHKANISTIV